MMDHGTAQRRVALADGARVRACAVAGRRWSAAPRCSRRWATWTPTVRVMQAVTGQAQLLGASRNMQPLASWRQQQQQRSRAPARAVSSGFRSCVCWICICACSACRLRCLPAGVVTLKGRAACEIDTADELMTTELMFHNAFLSLTHAQLVSGRASRCSSTEPPSWLEACNFSSNRATFAGPAGPSQAPPLRP